MQTEQFQLHADIEQRHWWFTGRRQIMRRLVDRLFADSPEADTGDVTVVDVGCGTGANIASLADGYRCVGIDRSAQAIELARQRFAEVRFFTGRAPDDLGDLVRQARLFVMMDVLEHVDDDFAMLSELLGAATPGSYFLLTVPADMALWSEHDEAFGHLRRYDRSRLERLWAGLPVTRLMISYFNARLLPVIRMIRARGRRRGRASGEAGTDFWLPTAPINRLLHSILAGESRRLVGLLHSGQGDGYRSGASLVTILRREEGPIPIRHKPVEVAADPQPA